MKVAKLTVKQKDFLIGQEVESGVKFNPIQDSNNIWIISLEEFESTKIEWVKALPLIDYKPKKVILA
jgi:hypothetical protein